MDPHFLQDTVKYFSLTFYSLQKFIILAYPPMRSCADHMLVGPLNLTNQPELKMSILLYKNYSDTYIWP